MRRLAVYAAVALGIFALGLGLGLTVNSRRASVKAATAQAQADQAIGEAKTHAAQAAATDRQATIDEKTVIAADARAAVARRELSRLSQALPKKAPAPLQPLPPTPESNALEATRAALAQAQEVVADQQTQIEARDRLIASLTASRDQWRATAEADERALAAQQIAQEATVRSEHAHGVRQQIIRGLEGLAVGYVAGRVRK